MIRLLRTGLVMAVTLFATAADLPVSGWTLKPGSTATASALRLEAALLPLMGNPHARQSLYKPPEPNRAVRLCLEDLENYLG